MKKKSKIDRLKIMLDVRDKLRNFMTSTFDKINLWDTDFSAIKELKKVFKEYISSEIGFSGEIKFVEIDRVIVYKLPIKENVREEVILRQL